MKKLFTLSAIILLLSSSIIQAQNLSLPLSCVKIGWGWQSAITYNVATPNPTFGLGCDSTTVTKVDISGWVGSFGITDFPAGIDWTQYDSIELLLYTNIDGVAFNDTISYKGYYNNADVVVDVSAIKKDGIAANYWITRTISLKEPLVNVANSAITYSSLSDPTLGMNLLQFKYVALPAATASLYFGGITLINKNNVGSEINPIANSTIIIANPVNDELQISNSISVKQVSIINTLGAIVSKTTNSNIVNTSNLPSGIYIAKIETSENKILTSTFIKK
jgi:hypothetical protein